MSTIKKKLLIITTYFPPVLSVASQRVFSFVKYLSPEKFDIKVIAWSDKPVEMPVIPGVSYEVVYLANPQLLKRATFTTSVPLFIHKIKALYNILLSFAGVNEMSGWGKLADKEIARMQSQWKPDVVLSTYPFEEALRVGIRCSEKYGTPLIADLRDGITNNFSHSFIVRFRLKFLEKKVVRIARRILTVSDPIVQDLYKKYPELTGKLFELRNGFDFDQGNLAIFNKVFTITFAGTFYGGNKPGHFFEALKLLLESGKIREIRLRFVGVVRNFHVPKEVEGFCEFLPRIRYEDTIPLLKKSDALLLIIAAGFKGSYSTKIFDYLGTMRPIIAIVDKDDVAAKLIRDCNAGFIADWDDPTSITNAITSSFELWEQKRQLLTDASLIGNHHRKILTAKLEKIIDELS